MIIGMITKLGRIIEDSAKNFNKELENIQKGS